MRTAEATLDPLYEELRKLEGQPYSPPTPARDPVNQPMIRHWCDAVGDTNPVYTDEEFASKSSHGGIVAPPTMLQAWTMRGIVPAQERSEPGEDGSSNNQRDLMNLLDEAGYSSVVATNCEQDYHRYLRPGDLLIVSSEVETISPRKKTALGEGYFITTLQTYKDQNGETVGEMRFRILKFKPPEREAPAPDELGKQLRPQPAINRDSAYFWEGADRGELLIQQCSSCKQLRHPPRPACPNCQSLEWDTLAASGKGEVYSYVVHHHPPLPGFEIPFAVALVELEEGVRMVGNLLDVPSGQVEIGMPVEVVFSKSENGAAIPQWRARR